MVRVYGRCPLESDGWRMTWRSGVWVCLLARPGPRNPRGREGCVCTKRGCGSSRRVAPPCRLCTRPSRSLPPSSLLPALREGPWRPRGLREGTCVRPGPPFPSRRCGELRRDGKRASHAPWTTRTRSNVPPGRVLRRPTCVVDRHEDVRSAAERQKAKRRPGSRHTTPEPPSRRRRRRTSRARTRPRRRMRLPRRRRDLHVVGRTANGRDAAPRKPDVARKAMAKAESGGRGAWRRNRPTSW